MYKNLLDEWKVMNAPSSAPASTPTPKDVKDALDMLKGLIKISNDRKLLIKIGKLYGIYSAYENIGDVNILEQLVIEMALLCKSVLLPSVTTNLPSASAYAQGGCTDLIYMNNVNNDDFVKTVDGLIDDFLSTLGDCSVNTLKNYASSLRRIFKDMKNEEETIIDNCIQGRAYCELAAKIEECVLRHPEYNHNIKSAANNINKYLRKLN